VPANAIISIAQHARPNVIGQTALPRPQAIRSRAPTMVVRIAASSSGAPPTPGRIMFQSAAR
jgi:hypothetical protein